MIFKKQKINEYEQKIKYLEMTCDNLDTLVDYKNSVIKNLIDKDVENEYRFKLLEKEKVELNNVISNLLEEKSKKTVSKLKKQKKLETDNRKIETASNI